MLQGSDLGRKCDRSRECGDSAGFVASPALSQVMVYYEVDGRNIYVYDFAGDFDFVVARSVADVALQPSVGILSQRRAGLDPDHSDCSHAGAADITDDPKPPPSDRRIS
jgi:hypothetical protein